MVRCVLCSCFSGNTKTRINIPDKASLDQNVSVVGTPAGIAQAVKEINRLLEPIGGYAAEDDEWVQDNEEAEGNTTKQRHHHEAHALHGKHADDMTKVLVYTIASVLINFI